MSSCLRTKFITKNRSTIYIDTYPPIRKPNGKVSRRTFLKLFYYNDPVSFEERKHNAKTEIEAKKMLDQFNNKTYIYNERGINRNEEEKALNYILSHYTILFFKKIEKQVLDDLKNSDISNYSNIVNIIDKRFNELILKIK